MKVFCTLLLYVAIASACGDNAYRCINPEGSISQDWAKTNYCCNQLAEDTCYCSHRAETYCDPYGPNIDRFKKCCESFTDFSWREC